MSKNRSIRNNWIEKSNKSKWNRQKKTLTVPMRFHKMQWKRKCTYNQPHVIDEKNSIKYPH